MGYLPIQELHHLTVLADAAFQPIHSMVFLKCTLLKEKEAFYFEQRQRLKNICRDKRNDEDIKLSEKCLNVNGASQN